MEKEKEEIPEDESDLETNRKEKLMKTLSDREYLLTKCNPKSEMKYSSYEISYQPVENYQSAGLKLRKRLRHPNLLGFFILLMILLAVFFFGIISQKPLPQNLPDQLENAENSSHLPATEKRQQINQSQGLLLVSLDGFRHDYLERGLTPAMNQFSQEGVRAKRLKSQFPSKTFTNHWSIITGLYSQSHGIIDNLFHDLENDRTFNYSDRASYRSPDWWGGEPLWATAEKQGVKSASLFWVGNDVQDWRRPSVFVPFNGSVSLKDRVDVILNWYQRPLKDRPKFVSFYIETVDSEGHRSGPNSEALNSQIKAVDDTLDSLFQGLKRINLYDQLDIIILSDHGMTKLEKERVIVLDKVLDLKSNKFKYLSESSNALIYPQPGFELEIYQNLTKSPLNMKVFVKDPIKYQALLSNSSSLHSSLVFAPFPYSFYFAQHKFVPEIYILADLGWSLVPDGAFDERWVSGGNHGYDPNLKDMNSIFLAKGPQFKKGLVVKQLNNIDMYSLMCSLLDIFPSPNNGTCPSYILASSS